MLRTLVGVCWRLRLIHISGNRGVVSSRVFGIKSRKLKLFLLHSLLFFSRQSRAGDEQVPGGALLPRVSVAHLDVVDLPHRPEHGENLVLVIVEPDHRAAYPRLGQRGAAIVRAQGKVGFRKPNKCQCLKTKDCFSFSHASNFSWEDPVDWLLETWPWPSYPR